VSSESLLPVLLESFGRVDEDLVVERLSGEPFLCEGRERSERRSQRVRGEDRKGIKRLTVRMKSNGRHGVHVWFGDVLDDDGNIVVPSSNGLVVRGRDEPTVVVDEGDGVDGSEMLVVLLDDLIGVDVVLEEKENGKAGRSAREIEGGGRCESREESLTKRSAGEERSRRKKGPT